jgi:hypothetical protein
LWVKQNCELISWKRGSQVWHDHDWLLKVRQFLGMQVESGRSWKRGRQPEHLCGAAKEEQNLTWQMPLE